MTNTLFKALLITALIALVFTQVPQNDAYGKYQQQSCCPPGYNSAQGVFCVKCN